MDACIRGRRHDDKFPVDGGVHGESARERLEVGIGVGNELLAARPQAPALAAFDELRANAVEFPFHDPSGRRTERRLHVGDRPLPGLRQIEGIGPARVERLAFGMGHLPDQRLEIMRLGRPSRLGVADHALRHPAFVDAGDLGQRFHDLQPRDADAQFAGDELEEGEPLIHGQFADPASQPGELLLVVQRRNLQELPHPDVQRNLLSRDALGQK